MDKDILFVCYDGIRGSSIACLNQQVEMEGCKKTYEHEEIETCSKNSNITGPWRTKRRLAGS